MDFTNIHVSDLVCINEEIEIISGNRAVNDVCHGHTIYRKAYSVFCKKLPAIMQDSVRFDNSQRQS
ncbi:hypothetical protein EDB80DRAFT_875841 [Ilyonectria destructans]|nr:hypothetical protein EDB80DRAFT_875841 [Ilyonectria destructans]